MTDLAWQLANLVYVPYCSSDAHMADSDHEVVSIIVIIVHIRETLLTPFVSDQRCFIGSRVLLQTGIFRGFLYLSYIYFGSSFCHIPVCRPVIFLSYSCRPVIVAER